MLPKINLNINQKLFISKDGADWYVTAVQDNDDDTFSIAVPYQMSQPLILYRGERVQCKMPGDGASFLFHTKVIGHTTDRVPLYILAVPHQCHRMQQREFVRLPILIPIKYALMPEDDADLQFQQATSVDLSGSGMKIAIKKPYKPGINLKLKFQLEIRQETVNFELTGEVKRLEVKQLSKNQRIYHAGVTFRNIPRADQDKIVAYVFARMCKQNQLC